MSINNQRLISSFTEFGIAKNIDKPTIIRMLNEVFENLIIKKYGSAENFDIIINPSKGDLQISHYQEIVENDSERLNEANTISLTEAQKIVPDFEVGEQVAENLNLEEVFTRRAIKQAFQLLVQKIQDIDKVKIYEKYKKLEGELINIEPYYIAKDHALFYDEQRNECIMPQQGIIPGENIKKPNLRAVIDKVEIVKAKVNILLSRTSIAFIEKILESEIPEIRDKLVMIEKIVRYPGIRTKVAVISYDDRVDAAGACIGVKGTRIKNIISEINHEQIDIINYTTNLKLYLTRALGIKPHEIHGFETTQNGTVFIDIDPEQVSLAIGRKGQNINLAGQLIDKEIKINDIPIEKFNHKLPKSTLEALKISKLDTAKTILALPTETLVERTQLNLSTIEVLQELLNQSMQELLKNIQAKKTKILF